MPPEFARFETEASARILSAQRLSPTGAQPAAADPCKLTFRTPAGENRSAAEAAARPDLDPASRDPRRTNARATQLRGAEMSSFRRLARRFAGAFAAVKKDGYTGQENDHSHCFFSLPPSSRRKKRQWLWSFSSGLAPGK